MLNQYYNVKCKKQKLNVSSAFEIVGITAILIIY